VSEAGGEASLLADGGAPHVDATSADASPLDDSSPPPQDAPSPTDAPVDAAYDGPCPLLPGPALVSINGDFCIDSTEVTVAQYEVFLAAKGGSLTGQTPICSWNTSLIPGGWPPSGSTALPVAGVNWCQAQLYCAWAGKSLCGTPDGGPSDPQGYTDPAQSQWFNVCTHNNDGLDTWPYGNTYQPKTCNGMDYGAGAPVPSLASCVGGYPGVFDMSGNVYEWEDRCMSSADSGAPNDYCFTRGGSYDEDAGGLRCDYGLLYSRQSQAPNVGLRCCTR
jgi:formylglycine-generating enzyme required for sulfatase activity